MSLWKTPSSSAWYIPRENVHVILDAWQYSLEKNSCINTIKVNCYGILFTLSIITHGYSTTKSWKTTSLV